MSVSKLWIWLSILAGVLMALASGAGVFAAGTYAKETVTWATQGAGQDLVNLFFAAPLLFLTAYFAHKKCLKSVLLWQGALVYVVYSYVIYAFFIHFGPWFLVYVAILGLSFYSLLGSSMNLDWNALSPRFAQVRAKPASVFLMATAVMFYFLWASEVAKALIAHTTPEGLNSVGLPVNPIHVLDMAFLLPAMAIVSVNLWKRKAIGLILAVPLLTFSILMGTAIVSMMLFLTAKGFPVPVAMEATMGLWVLIAVYLTVNFLADWKAM
jgi:hypothetical protein